MCRTPDQAASRSPCVPFPAPGGATGSPPTCRPGRPCLGLPRVSGLAAADDQLLPPALDVERGSPIDPGQVTGVAPAVADRPGGGLGAIPSAPRPIRPGDDAVPRLTLRDRVILAG